MGETVSLFGLDVGAVEVGDVVDGFKLVGEVVGDSVGSDVCGDSVGADDDGESVGEVVGESVCWINQVCLPDYFFYVVDG